MPHRGRLQLLRNQSGLDFEEILARPIWERYVPESGIETVRLRDVQPGDIPALHQHQINPEANWMAAFTAPDWDDLDIFTAHWMKLLVNDAIGKQTILYREQIAGSILQFVQFGQPSVSYWIGPEFWGKGIMTRALGLFLAQVDERPLYARAAKDNTGSIRVLDKCGFKIIGEDTGFAHARNADVEEYILELAASAD
jgi:RimJ/RimL family protein N-acetyltransferase